MPWGQVSWDGPGSCCTPMLCDPKEWLTLSELLDIVGGGSLGLGPSRNIWRPGFQPQLCQVLTVLWRSPSSSPASVTELLFRVTGAGLPWTEAAEGPRRWAEP